MCATTGFHPLGKKKGSGGAGAKGESFDSMGRVLGAPMHHVRSFLYQSGGVRQVLQRRSVRHPTAVDREEIFRGIAAGQSARLPARRLGQAT